MRRVLSIDGGGIKGIFPASFLASIEDALGCTNVADYFDLIVGTSTGGIIALGLGLGISAREILNFYEERGPAIFKANRLLCFLKQFGISKYGEERLRNALSDIFGERKLGESRKRLVIPSFNLETGEVHIWKTSHHPRLERDYRAKVIDVALSTAAAPTFFPTHRSAAGSPLIDGGIWANNPIGVGVVESIGILQWRPHCLRILSIGCTTTPLNINWGRRFALGRLYWAIKLVDVFLIAQSSFSLGMAQHLVTNRENIIRISPMVGRKFGLDKLTEIPSLKGLGDSEARKALPQIRPIFFHAAVSENFEPYHKLEESFRG